MMPLIVLKNIVNHIFYWGLLDMNLNTGILHKINNEPSWERGREL